MALSMMTRNKMNFMKNKKITKEVSKPIIS